MKKITSSGVLFAFLFALSSVFAQNKQALKAITKHYDMQKLDKLAKTFQKDVKKEQQEAYRYAATRRIPTLIKKPNGGISVLQRVTSDGTLIYYTTMNSGSAITTRTNSLYKSGSLGLDIEGQGMVMAIWDGGAVRATHELLTGRVQQMDDATDLNSHSTHVAGTLIGAAEPKDGAARGMAFKARLKAFDFNDDIPEITTAAGNGLLVSNHSYGYDPEELPTYYFGRYDEKAQDVDQIIAAAPHYLMVVAAGNSRNADEDYNPKDNGYDLLTDIAVAKNDLTVAAVKQVSDYTGPESVKMPYFSSWGPTDDGRIKPDISAKGVNVYSSTADSDQSYAHYSGTSMATPNVAGSLLLLQQLNRNLHGDYLKGATIKALAIHSALEAGSTAGPDYRFGWGLLNMKGAAQLILDEGFTSQVEEHTLNESAVYTEKVDALGEDQPLKVTVVWADPAGPLQPKDTEDDTTKRLVNDLDVRIEDEQGNITYPWTLAVDDYTSAAEKADNDVDNVEKIELPGAVGKYTISVSHKGQLQNGKQDYSLVISGISKSEFTFAPDNKAKTFCSSQDADYTFNFLADKDYNDKTNFSVTDLPQGLTTSFSEIDENHTFDLKIGQLGSVQPGTYTFTVTGNGGSSAISKKLELTILDAALPKAVILSSPSEKADDVSVFPTLVWEKEASVQSYVVEVSQDKDFNGIILSRETEGLSLKVPGLQDNTTYYWRVKPKNNCATGAFSKHQFTTETLYCGDPVFAEDTPRTIGETGQNIQTSFLTIPASKNTIIGTIKVNVKVTHSNLGDLKIYLVSPEGKEIILLNNLCGDRKDMDVVFDDTAVDFACDNDDSKTLMGIIKPQEPLNSLIGKQAAGKWLLRVVDGAAGNGGTIDRFGLTICGNTVLDVKRNLLKKFQLYPNPASEQVTVNWKGGGKDVSVKVYDLNGKIVLTRQKQQTSWNRLTLDTSALQSGIYFVKLRSDGKWGTKKLIIH